jgi:hypothetical protein
LNNQDAKDILKYETSMRITSHPPASGRHRGIACPDFSGTIGRNIELVEINWHGFDRLNLLQQAQPPNEETSSGVEMDNLE